MAILQQKHSFSNGIIEERNGEFYITEINENSVDVFNLSEMLRNFVGVTSVSLDIKTENVLEGDISK